jgi:hypothetical protein
MAETGANATGSLQVVIPVIAAILGALMGAFGGWFGKIRELRYQERKTEATIWLSQKQTHWFPLRNSAQELKKRLQFLKDIYDRKPNMPFDPNSLSADFRELYLMRRDEVTNLQNTDPDAPRKDKDQVQNMRSRMCHELTFAESCLYITATVSIATAPRASALDGGLGL